MKSTNSRAVAAKILSQWIAEQRFPDRQLARVQKDNAFVMEMVNGVIRNKLAIEWVAHGMVREQPEPYFEAVLFVGLYQMLFMDVEEYAIINETVNAAKEHPAGEGSAKMINAVLRRAQREKEQILRGMSRQPEYVRLGHPEQAMRRWSNQYGELETRKLCEWNNQPPETILRVENRLIPVHKFVKICDEEGIELTKHPYHDSEPFYIVPRGISVASLPGYVEGWFSIQDPATSIAVDLLAPTPGETILDACAAPGGKTAMIASRMHEEGELVAMDVHDDRIATLKTTLSRLQLNSVDVIKGNAGMAQEALGNRTFDAILLDVPCLNSGVLRRRIDARWRLTPGRIKSITQTQYAILSGCAKLLKEDGRLVYSTCSLEPEENEDLISRWVRENPGFRRVKAKKAFPPTTKTDGAFAALIQRDED